MWFCPIDGTLLLVRISMIFSIQPFSLLLCNSHFQFDRQLCSLFRLVIQSIHYLKVMTPLRAIASFVERVLIPVLYHRSRHNEFPFDRMCPPAIRFVAAWQPMTSWAANRPGKMSIVPVLHVLNVSTIKPSLCKYKSDRRMNP